MVEQAADALIIADIHGVYRFGTWPPPSLLVRSQRGAAALRSTHGREISHPRVKPGEQFSFKVPARNEASME